MYEFNSKTKPSQRSAGLEKIDGIVQQLRNQLHAFMIAVYLDYLLFNQGTRGTYHYWRNVRNTLELHSIGPPATHRPPLYGGAVRISNYSKEKRALPPDMLHALVDANRFELLFYIKFVVICLPGSTMFIYLDEILNLIVDQIQFHESYTTIFLPKCKNDQSWEWNTIYVAEQGPKYNLAMKAAIISNT